MSKESDQRGPRLSNAAGVRQSVFASLQTHIEAYTSRGGDLIPLHIGDTYLEPPPLGAPAAGHQELSMYGAPAGVENRHLDLHDVHTGAKDRWLL